MVEWTVGYVAGIIAAVTALVRIWTPNTLVYIISGVLGDKNTAVTWSVAGRALQASLWPDFLRTDTALTRGVRWDVRILVKAIQLMKIFIAIAGIITPLGLYSAIGRGNAIIPRFEYVKDTSPFGISTPHRANFTFGRTCNRGIGLAAGPMPCPYTHDIVYQNATHYMFPYNLTYTIPQTLVEIYGSGTRGWSNTIANYWDIEWRTWSTAVGKFYNNGSDYVVGAYRQVGSLLLRDEILPIEGLLVDTIDGGIGFRNHTLPVDVGVGGSWSEDILFIEPESACVNTNLTLEFSVLPQNSTGFGNGRWTDIKLVDRGGFALMNQTYPYIDRDNSQTAPNLRQRAYKAAWLNNAYTALFFNVTNPSNDTKKIKAWSYLNSEVGKGFPIKDSDSVEAKFEQLRLIPDFATYLGGNLETSTKLANTDYPNPFNIKAANFSDIGMLCKGAGRQDIANITNILVDCGMMYGAATRIGEGSNILFDAGSRWTIPLYACATAVKATIRKTDFLLNGTNGLSSLKVTSTRPKVYDNASLPLWAMEDSGRTLENFQPIWGLIHPAYEKYPNMSTIRQESFYLPGISYNSLGRYSWQNMPGSDFYRNALKTTYELGDFGGTSSPSVDYSGFSNLPLYVRWQNYSSRAETAGRIPNLVWTDLAAGAVVGTKSSLGSRQENTPSPVRIVVNPLRHQIKYRWAFAIPAFLVLLLCLAIASIALLTCVFHRHNLTKLRKHLYQTAPGRIFTSFIFPEYSALTTSTPLWNQSVGKNPIDLSGDNPLMSALAQNNFYKADRAVGGQGFAGQGGPISPLEKGMIQSDREITDAPDRVPSPYQGGGGLHEQSVPLTGMPHTYGNGYRG